MLASGWHSGSHYPFKPSMLTKSRIRKLYEYNADTGVFRPKSAKPAKAYRRSDGTLLVRIDNKRYPLAVLAWILEHSAYPQESIRHKNGDKTDLRISNLELIPESERIKEELLKELEVQQAAKPKNTKFRAEIERLKAQNLEFEAQIQSLRSQLQVLELRTESQITELKAQIHPVEPLS